MKNKKNLLLTLGVVLTVVLAGTMLAACGGQKYELTVKQPITNVTMYSHTIQLDVNKNKGTGTATYKVAGTKAIKGKFDYTVTSETVDEATVKTVKITFKNAQGVGIAALIGTEFTVEGGNLKGTGVYSSLIFTKK